MSQDKPSYSQQTNRIKAWSQLISSISPFLWTAVILIVVIPLIGTFLISSSVKENTVNVEKKVPQEVVVEIPDKNELDRALVTAFEDAHTKAESYASQQLDEWVDDLMARVDNSFLDWYFDYFNQKKMEFTAPLVWVSSAVKHSINTDNPTANQAVAEKLTADFQTEFAKRVLRPKIAQLQLERITRETINLYVSELSKNISSVQSQYDIPQGQWERYLDDIAITIADTEGNISNLSMKILLGGSSYLLAKAMFPLVTKIGSQVALSFAGKASAKMAAKTGGLVAGKLGAQFIDPIVAVGIIIWDVWDYNHTVKVERPVLREAISDYLQEVKASLLDNQENSIMGAIYELETGILRTRF